jgi:hypothetical protein
MYLSGAVMMVGSMLARKWCEVRVVVPMIGVWTGLLLVASLFHLDEFDLSLTQSRVWFAAYTVYPAIALGLWLARRSDRGCSVDGHARPIQQWVRRYFGLQGAVFTVLGLALLIGATWVTDYWPWNITPLLANLYAAPFLSFGAGSLLATRESSWLHVRTFVVGTLVFAAGVLCASVLHRALFTAGEAPDFIWFAGFSAVVCALLAALAVSGRASPAGGQ